MNNDQFRKFIANKNTGKTQDADQTKDSKPAAPALGSRLKNQISMTPRAVKGSSVKSEFTRQVADKNAGSRSIPKTSIPKGTKLAAGYIDRTKQRNDDENDDRAKRIKALEESMKLGQIDEETFAKLRDEIVGGDASATHLVKGLDRRLLERVRRGEDTSKAPETLATTPAEDEGPPKDIDDEFDDLENKEIAPIAREERVKQGEVAPKKLSRDEIMAQFRAARAAAKPKPKAMASGFKKVGHQMPQEGVRMEIDSQGREVMIISDADGKTKRKVRKGQALPEVDETKEKLGMEIEDAEEAPQVPLDHESDDDIFAGVEEYDPLAGLSEDDDEEEVPAAKASAGSRKNEGEGEGDAASPTRSSRSGSPVNPGISTATKPRNYFNDDPSTFSVLSNAHNPRSDPSILANLTAKARQIDPSRFDPSAEESEASRLKRKAAMLAGRDRDMDDIDMGFGASRGDDQDEMEMETGGKRQKLSEWKGLAGGEDDEDDEDEGGKKGGGKKRKRGGGKRKGDKNDVGDVMRVMEMQKNR